MHLGQVVETPESGYKENGFRIAFRDKVKAHCVHTHTF